MRKENVLVLLFSFSIGLSIAAHGTFALANEDVAPPAPSITVCPEAHMFEGVQVNDSSAKIFTVTNKSDEKVTLGTIILTEDGLTSCEADDCPQIDPGSFILRKDSCSGENLLPSESCSLEVAFSPVSEGLKIAYLSVPISDSRSPQPYILLSGSTPQPLDSEASEVVISLMPNQLVDLRCKTEPGQKIWVLINLPSIDPDFWFVRPSDAHCVRTGHCISVFSQYGALAPDAEELYYHDSYRGKSINLGINDFTGLGEVVIVVKKGDSPDRLETIQSIRIIGADPLPPVSSN